MMSSPRAPDAGLGWLRDLWQRGWLRGLLLVVAVVFAYQPVWHAGFIWDDDAWTMQISDLLQDFSGLGAMWFHSTAMQQYYPLTGTTFWIDHQLWGLWPLPYHVENILLHALAALLFGKLLCELKVPGAWLASAIFAFHPLMVESVGWITERKNTLSLVFFLGALLAYGRFTRFWTQDDDRSFDNSQPPCRGAYKWSLFLFLGALLAKTTTCSLPAVILLICWWKRGIIRWRRDVRPTLPFFILAAGLSLTTFWLETHHVGARGPDWDISFPTRCLIAGHVLWFYAGKLLWPVNLCFIYPRWHPNPASLEQWLWPATAIGVLLVLWLARSRIGRGPAAAAFFFAGTLFPVLGFLNAYYMTYSFVCDHLAYLSSLGFIALGAAMVVRVFGWLQMPWVRIAFSMAILPALFILTWRQSEMYTSPEILWRTTIVRNPDCSMAYNNLGLLLQKRGQVDEALADFQKAVALQPDHAENWVSLGGVFAQTGRLDKAIGYLKKALEIRPDYAEGLNDLGCVFYARGKLDEAIIQFQKAVQFQPHNKIAQANLQNALFQKGWLDEAMVHLQKTLEIKPHDIEIMNRLAWMLATSPAGSLRNGARAVELAREADQLSGGKDPTIAGTLAAAYAETGRFPEAIATAQWACQTAIAQNRISLADTIKAQIELYQAGCPSRDTRLTNHLANPGPP